MNLNNVSGKIDFVSNEAAIYFGLKVEVIVKMKNCSLIRWGDGQFVVDSEDLQLVAKQAA